MRATSFFIGFATLLCLVGAGAAQVVDSSVRGRALTLASDQVLPAGDLRAARDLDVSPVAGAEITLRNLDTGIEQTSVSDGGGNYAFVGVAPGSYELSARSAGRTSPWSTRVELETGTALQMDLLVAVSEPGGTSTVRVDVSATRALLNTESAALGTVIPNDYIVNLPLDGRNFLELALLAAGTTPAAVGSAGAARGRFAFQAAGARDDANSFIYDGVYAIDPTLNSFSFTPPVDAVQEFRVQTSNTEAGLGRASGGQVSVDLKRGSNQFHGTAYEFLRNDAMDARNFFDLPDRDQPKLRRNQFGGSIGGPLKKNSTFFFADYERLDETRAITRSTNVPTAAERTGDFSQSALPQPIDFTTFQPFPNATIPDFFQHPIGRGLANFYPQANRAVVGQNFTGAPDGEDAHHKFDVRVDHKISNAGTLAARYSFADRTRYEPYGTGSFADVPGFGNDIEERGQNVMVSETHTFGSRWVNEARFGFNRIDNRTFHENTGTSINQQLGLPDFASRDRDLGLTFIQITGLSPLGDEFNNPQDSAFDSWQLSDHVSASLGSHLLEFGVEQRWVAGDAFRDVQSRGQITFTDFAFTQSALGDVLLGLPTFTGGARSDNVQKQRMWATNLFVSDSWRASPRLTLNWGMRYEFAKPPYDADDAAAVFDFNSGSIVQVGTNGIPRGGHPSDTNNFAPRLGLAWSLDQARKTVLRAGYGLHYNTGALAPGQLIYFNPPFFNFELFFPSAQTGQLIQLQDPWPSSNAFPIPPSTQTFDQNLRTSYSQQWNVTLQRELADGAVFSLGYNGTRGTKLVGSRDVNQPLASPQMPNLRPNPFFADINQTESSFDSIYHAFEARLQARFHRGLTGLFSYAWSRSIDNASGFFSSAGNSNFPQNSYDTSAERGRSAFDVPHRFVGSFAYDLPFGRGQRWGSNWSGAPAAILGGWRINGVITLQSGQPYSVYLPSGLDNSNTGQSIQGFGANDRPNVVGNPNLSNPDPAQWINPAAFAFPQFGSFGDAGRNVVQGPPLHTTNFSAIKEVPLAETVDLQLRLETFNLFNKPNFLAPNIFFGTPGFGQITAARDARELQFGVKLIF